MKMNNQAENKQRASVLIGYQRYDGWSREGIAVIEVQGQTAREVAQVLCEHYNSDFYGKTRDSIRDMVKEGDAYRIAEKIKPDNSATYDFENEDRRVCIFNGRDYGFMGGYKAEIYEKISDIPTKNTNLFFFDFSMGWVHFFNGEQRNLSMKNFDKKQPQFNPIAGLAELKAKFASAR